MRKQSWKHGRSLVVFLTIRSSDLTIQNWNRRVHEKILTCMFRTTLTMSGQVFLCTCIARNTAATVIMCIDILCACVWWDAGDESMWYSRVIYLLINVLPLRWLFFMSMCPSRVCNPLYSNIAIILPSTPPHHPKTKHNYEKKLWLKVESTFFLSVMYRWLS